LVYKKNAELAFNCFRFAGNNSTAKYFLGMCYELGRGAPQNFEDATTNYKLAADGGNENAIKALKRLNVTYVS